MGGAFVAIADDTSAGYWNPAGLAFTHDWLTQTELKFEQIDVQYTPPGNSVQYNRTGTIFVPALGVLIPTPHHQVPTVEFLGYVPYGLQLDWSDDAAYRYNVTHDAIRVFSIGGTSACRANDRLAWGVAAFVNSGEITLENKVPSSIYADVPGLPDATFAASGNDANPNLHLGVFWQATPTLSLGAAYRSPIDLIIHGSARLSIPGGSVIDDQWTMPITLPQSISMGAAWRATPTFLVAAQVDWVDWSTIDQQVITFQHGALPAQRVARNWRDRVQPRLGVEYTGNRNLVLRAGYTYDSAPVPDSTLDPQLFDLNRHVFAIGAGIAGSHWALDGSLEYFLGQSRTTVNSVHAFPTNGRYSDHVDVLTLTISYRP